MITNADYLFLFMKISCLRTRFAIRLNELRDFSKHIKCNLLVELI